MVEAAPRSWITVKGADARKFLNGLLTNDIQNLKEGAGCYNVICTPKGKMIADLFCYDCGDFFGIDSDFSQRETIFNTLKKYIIFNKVELVDESEQWKRAVVIGPKAGSVPSSPLPRWERGAPRRGEGAMKTQKIWWNLPWFEIWSQTEIVLALPKIPYATQEVLRIESGTPLFGVDMNENTIPQEANLHNALNFNKGCYVGQETIARLEHRGHVGKKLVQLKIEGTKIPQPGEKILNPKREEIGLITSSCFSPKFQSTIALGTIRYAALGEKEVVIADQTAVPI